MKHSLIFVSIILLLTISALAQPPQTLWTRTYGGSYNDYFTSVDATNDGGFILGGYTESFGFGSYDVYAIKTDADGFMQWELTFGTYAEDMADCVIQTSDEGYAFLGHAFEMGSFYQFYLIKLNADGTTAWERFYGGEGDDQGKCLKQNADNSYILAGYCDVNTGPASEYNACLRKVDSAGNPIWDCNYGGANADEARSVDLTADGGYILAGYTQSFGAGQKDVYLVKTDANGVVEWEHTYGGASDDDGYSVIQTDDGGYLVGGYTETSASSFQFYLIKTDEDGIVEWEQIIGEEGMDQCYHVEQTNDGNYVFSGKTSNYGAASLDACVIKIDTNGNILWTKLVGTELQEIGYCVKQTQDNGFIVAAKTGLYFSDDAYLFRLDAEGAVYDVSVTLTPYSAPIQIPANGGSFEFNIEVANNMTSTANTDIWTLATLPNGSEYGPIINVNYDLAAGFSANRDRFQNVPANAPAGDYTYDAYVGVYPDVIWDEDHFEFTKLSSVDNSLFVSNWKNWGESFKELTDESSIFTPDDYALLSAYPNPFNPATTIALNLPEAGNISLAVYDIQGRQVANLIDGFTPAGYREIKFDASGLSSGIYYIRLSAAGQQHTQKLLLLK